MTKTDQEIRAELRKFVEKFAPTLAEVCTVKSVDENKQTAVLISTNDNTEFVANLSSGEVGNLILIPKIGSVVFARMAENSAYYISLYSEVDKIKIFGGENGGVVKVSELVSEFKKLIDEINALKQIFATWTPVPSDGGAALKTALNTWTKKITPKDKQIFENDKFLH